MSVSCGGLFIQPLKSSFCLPQNLDYNSGSEDPDEAEVLRAAETPHDADVTFDVGADLNLGSAGAMVQPKADEEEYDHGEEPPADDLPEGAQSPEPIGSDYGDLSAGPPSLPGNTPGNELTVVDDTPGRDAEDDGHMELDEESAPELGNSGIMPAPALTAKSAQRAQPRRNAPRVEVGLGAPVASDGTAYRY